MNHIMKFCYFAFVFFTYVAAASGVDKSEIIYGQTIEGEKINQSRKDGEILVGLAGGKNSTVKNHRYIAAINHDDSFVGSAIVINKKWLVTAAWNVFWAEGKEFEIRVGSSYAYKGGKSYKVKNVTTHPNYNRSWAYDISLIQLEKPIKFTKSIKPISVASKLPKSGTKVVVSGWGWDKKSVAGTQVLKAATVPFLDNAACKPYYQTEEGFTELSICTIKAGVGPCAKDFGSPLVYKNKLIGVFSGAYECAGTSYPPVYADVTKYKKWIEKIIKNRSSNEEKEELFDGIQSDES